VSCAPCLNFHQYKEMIPSFLSMPVSNMMQFLLPHRLVIVDEDAITVECFLTMVKERVNGAAVVNKGQEEGRGGEMRTRSCRQVS
jgi:hypothetical protein